MLYDTGMRVPTLEGVNARAQDNKGYVTIAASTEAIQDYGWAAIFVVAEAKLTAGNFQHLNDVRKVVVHSADCREHT